MQYYLQDTLIDPTGAAYPDERLLGTGFLNLSYRRGNFMAGVRYENYQNNRVGLPEGYKGEGIAYRYARYINEKFDITAGNYYEQFGSGLTLRTFEERGLGLDNNLDGIRMIFTPTTGVRLKGIIGRQRNFFQKSEGIVRGFDGEWSLKPTLGWESNTNLIIGGSFVSKFQEANDPVYNFPENVATGAVRANLITGAFNFYGEYAYKGNDPSADNNYIYKDGEALYLNATYANRNFGATLGFKRYDNFSFRSERVTDPQQLMINFLPSLTTLHTYALPALYSFNTIAIGEAGMQTEIFYNFKRKTALGGRYGMLVTASYAISNSLDKDYQLRPLYNPVDTSVVGYTESGSEGYSSEFFGLGPYRYFQDFHLEIKRKINRDWKATFTYYNFQFNNSAQRKGVTDYSLYEEDKDPEMFYINAAVLELLWKVKPKHSLRSEWQILLTDEDRGDWALALLEYSIAPHWFFAVQDAWNYGNADEDLRVHYVNVNFGYTYGTTKIQLGYGRQQEGVFCVGGICRVVPASNGFTLSLTSNF